MNQLHAFSTNQVCLPGRCKEFPVAIRLLVIWTWLAAGVLVVQAQSYSLTDLGFPPLAGAGSASEAHGMNQHGDVVGTWWDGKSGRGSQYAFWYADGTNTDLGTIKSGGYDYAVANAINNAGQIVGQATTSGGGGYIYHAFLYTNGIMTDLDNTGQGWSSANAINHDGEIVGEFTTPLGLIHGFIYTNGGFLDLGTLGGTYSSAKGINDSGVIVGEASDASNNVFAFVYNHGFMTNLGTLGGTYSAAFAINDSGVIAGESSVSNGEVHAFIYRDGVMRDLGTFGGTNSTAQAINNGGEVTGYALTTNEDAHAFLFNGATMVDLHQAFIPPAGWTNIFLTLAYAINDAGQVAGGVNYITNGMTNYDAFLLTPPVAASSPTLGAGGTFSVGIQGAAGQTYVIQASTNLLTWIPILTNTLTGTSTNWSDADAGTNDLRFYRVLTLPQ